SHIEINSTFSGFGSSTRQRYYLVNKNGAGGYTFVYNTAFNSNAAAAASFERALNTWRCATFVNFNRSGTTAIATAAMDGANVVTFDGTLPVGVLGRATSRFNGSATGGCNLANTIWWTDEIDVQFFPDPPTAGFPWEYGPAAPSFTEYDFESVAVHELGHAHGLGHVIFAAGVMHFALSNGSSLRNLNANDIAGGTAKMAYSTAPLCFTPASVTGPMIAVAPGACTLPVEYLSLEGRPVLGKGNLLEWTLSQEIQNEGFEVERSLDGQSFIPIGFVPGVGNSHSETEYAFLDAAPAAGILNYYRLRQLDQNGNANYSHTIAVHSLEGPAIQVLPTKVEDDLRIIGDGNGLTDLLFTLTDLRGAVVLSQALPQGQMDVHVALDKLASGMYIFNVRSSQGRVLSGKVIKE
ncbi:MAG TPA: matrixin family metalloprotease, partial [Bacteroidia bacterium]|nr:matrixin family metalloprotease [Bacteroidia bacterium]